MSHYVNPICPMCGHDTFENEFGDIQCEFCKHILPFSTNTTTISTKSNEVLVHEEKNDGTELPNGAMMGWICPKCGKALSPYVSECPCSVKWELTCDSSPTTPVKIEDIGNCSDELPPLTYNEKGLYKHKNGWT